MKSVFVTGSSGQIGRHLCRHFRAQGYFVAGTDRTPDDGRCHDFVQADLTGPSDGVRALLASRDFDAVIHLAAIVAPTDLPDERVLTDNVAMTYNVARAAAQHDAGPRRLIYLSSESVLGYAFSKPPSDPLSIPITESHPTFAFDGYGLSKLIGEQICSAYQHATSVPVFVLRPPWVWFREKVIFPWPEEPGQQAGSIAGKRNWYPDLLNRPEIWAYGLWAYIVVDDLCDVVERAAAIDGSGINIFFVTAKDSGTRRDSISLLKEFYPNHGRVARGFGGRDSIICSEAARTYFGWRPRWDWKSWRQHLIETHETAVPASAPSDG